MSEYALILKIDYHNNDSGITLISSATEPIDGGKIQLIEGYHIKPGLLLSIAGGLKTFFGGQAKPVAELGVVPNDITQQLTLEVAIHSLPYMFERQIEDYDKPVNVAKVNTPREDDNYIQLNASRLWLMNLAGRVFGGQEETGHNNYPDEEVPKPKPVPPKPAPPKPEAPPVARATVRKGPGLGERISKGIVDHPGRVFIPMSLVGVMALALGVSEVGKITYEAGKTVVDHPILGWAIVSGIINSLIANAFEQKVYQRSGFENIKQVVFDSAKYSVLWGIIISNSELLQNFFNIYNTSIRSNNALVKIFQSLPEWSQSARDYAFLATFFTQNLLAIFTGKLKRPELLKKLGVEQFETIPEAMAVYFFPYLLPLNIVSMIYAGVKFAKRVAKQEGDKHR